MSNAQLMPFSEDDGELERKMLERQSRFEDLSQAITNRLDADDERVGAVWNNQLSEDFLGEASFEQNTMIVRTYHPNGQIEREEIIHKKKGFVIREGTR